MRKIIRFCCLALGTALLLAAVVLVLHNITEDRQGGRQSELLLADLKEVIPEPETETMLSAEVYDLFAEYDQEPETVSMQEIEINGKFYIGWLAVPGLALELPVLSEWNYPDLKTAPCRYAGTLQEHNLVICAHNYQTHFGRIQELNSDDQIIFTDVSGRKFYYSVINTEQIPGTAPEEIRSGHAEDWDLTLFTCTLDGQNRVTVRAAEEAES